MLPCNGVSRIKLKRDLFKQDNKLEPNKRRWTGPKTVSGLNPLADRGIQVQGQDSSPASEAANAVSSERNAKEICATADPDPPSYFVGQASSKQDDRAEHDDIRGRYNQGTLPSTVSGLSNCGDGITKAHVTCTGSRSAPKKTLKRLSEHKKEFFYRLRLALCFARKKHPSGGKRVIHGPTGTSCPALSYINSEVSVESDNSSIKSTVCGESVDQTAPAQLDPNYDKKTGSPDYVRQENRKPRRGRKPRKLFIDHFGGSDGQVKTTIKTEVRRDHASKARPTVSGRTPSDPLSGATGSTYISDTAETPDGCVKEWDACLARNPDCERMRQTNVEGTASVLPRCEDNGPVVCFCEKDEACPMKNISESPSSPVRRVPPLILRRVTVNGFAFKDVSEKSGLSPVEEEQDSRNEDSDSEVNSPESFSCQRAQAYIFSPQSSCARTCKIWPFPRMCPPNELRSSHQTGPRWIVDTLFPATDQTSLGVAPECLSDNDVQNKLYKPTKQSKSSDETREVLEGQILYSAPGEKPPTNMLTVLERTSKDRAESLNNPRGTVTRDIFNISKLADNNTCSVLVEKPPTCTLERTSKDVVDSPRVILTHVSKPAELESNLLKKAFEDASEYSAPVVTEHVNNYKLNGLGYAVSLEGSSLLKNHSLLRKSYQKPLSIGSENQSDVSLNRDGKLPKDLLYPKPVSQTSRELSFEDQEGNKNDGRRTLYNPESLSKICLKAQHSLVTASSVDQDTKSVTPNYVVHTPDSNPACSGEEKRTQVFDSYTITDDSSDDENKNVTSLSSNDESVEHHAAQSLWSDEDGAGQIKYEKQGSIPPPSPGVTDSFLDVSRAYDEDVLILDVIQDDPELFGAIVTETANKRDTENEETQLKTESIPQTGNHDKIVWDLKTDRISESHSTAADIKMENMKDGGSGTVKETQPAQGMNALKSENAADCNNNQEMRETNNLHATTVIHTRATRPVMDTCSNGRELTAKETSNVRTSNVNYCWYYFSEYNTCMRGVCWFPHVPRDGDEKFCMDTVKKFCNVGKPTLILRAVEVLLGYYKKCSPSASFSQETVNSLLSSLLNMCLLREFEAVTQLLLTHKRLPPPEIMLAAFKLVRERGLFNTVPELILLTSKIVEAGCVFSVDQCEVMQSHLQMMQVPRQQMDIFLAVKCRALSTNPHTSGLSDLAQAVVRVEMLKHQNDWTGLALVFCGVCVGSHSPTELLRFCCCVTMALLQEPKDKLALPYELFAESVCQQASSNEIIKTILGRIGVSLIFRYHRTQEWNKGVKLVSVMFRLNIEFITLKGIMGNEHRVSRCQLVTLATEFFLHSGSIEGALKMLRADGWFVSSSMWPCEQADIESRKHVLTLLAEKTSNRDTFEILTNLPGLRQPINDVQIKDYTEMFSAHLRLCMLKQTLPVAADIVEFMLMQGMVPETLQLQNLIHKLGKQNNWSRARALFKRARSAGFYTAVVCEREGLFLPCSLTEIEMTLAFEMFITFINTNQLAPAGSSQPFLITLRRHAGVEDVTESVYLAAGCRLLSAALIPNPKLSIRYTAVNQSQEQLFQLDRGSAHKWFLQNDRWAQEIWAS